LAFSVMIITQSYSLCGSESTLFFDYFDIF